MYVNVFFLLVLEFLGPVDVDMGKKLRSLGKRLKRMTDQDDGDLIHTELLEILYICSILCRGVVGWLVITFFQFVPSSSSR